MINKYKGGMMYSIKEITNVVNEAINLQVIALARCLLGNTVIGKKFKN